MGCRNTILIYLCLALGSYSAESQEQSDWKLFEEATFNEIFVKEFFSFKSLLNPDDEILALEGKELFIIGYYIPVATQDNSIILSKTPFASCFFCGSAGQETVLDVRIKKPLTRNFIADDKIRVKGILKLNTSDWETLSFILEESVILEN